MTRNAVRVMRGMPRELLKSIPAKSRVDMVVHDRRRHTSDGLVSHVSETTDPAKRLAPWLWLLTGLFAFRVAAQPLARVWEWLPPFEAWHSATLPYGWLVFFQLLILLAMIRISLRFSRGRVRASRGVGTALLAFGGLYLGVMLTRLVLGATAMRGDAWFDRPLPTTFHLVLTGFVIAVGWHHLRGAAE